MSRWATVWRLADAGGVPVQCVISERDGRWLLIVRRGRNIALSERCSSDDAALRRAHEIWQVFVQHGCNEPRH